MASLQNPKWQKRRPLDDIPGLKLDVVLEGRHSVIKVEGCGHTLVFDDLTRENDIDRDSEKWQVHFDGELVARMYPHPDHGWPKVATPQGRDKVQAMRAWIWEMARAHKVNAENILEIKDHQFPKEALVQLSVNDYQDPEEPPAVYFRRALRHVWEL